jgi:two-component system, chemotaxis family, CheB/CheR fusion protein
MRDEEIDPQFESLLQYLKSSRNFDFVDYKRSSLMRRVQKRMLQVKIDSFGDYQDYLEVHPDEFDVLFDTILINVTSFFRDKPAWDYLAAEIIPRLVQNRNSGELIRIWSAGCASGEEAYSLVMLLAEHMGMENCRRWVKVYATDVDEDALIQARHAHYSAESLKAVPAEFRDKYFEPNGDGYAFTTALRRILVFGRHDLMYDAPISHLDLLCCRNTLIYFNREAQDRIVARFHFALNSIGYLFLGKAEMLLSYTDLFNPEHPRYRIFAKVRPAQARDPLMAPGRVGDFELETSLAYDRSLKEAAFQATPDAVVVVDWNGNLAAANDEAASLFRLESRDVGRSFHDLEISYRPAELRSLVEQARNEGRILHVKEIAYRDGKREIIYLDVQVTPLRDKGGHWLGAQITFRDVSEQYHLRFEVERSRQEVETAYEELQSANEELETSNEELQSTVEELQTTNEELQATNEELQAINDELHQRTDELDRTNTFLQSILTSVDVGIVVIDRDFQVLLWNDRAGDLWGLRSDEAVGRSLLSLDIGLAVRELETPIQDTWRKGNHSGDEIVLDAVNRRGKAIKIRITRYLRQVEETNLQCMVLLMKEKTV